MSKPSKNSLISVIIPVYNVKPYLRQCLDSVIKQTYENLEIIIIDDGSTDGSESICDEYNSVDSRISIFHTTNKGLSAARNLGLNSINDKSEYIVFIDSDDWMEINAIQQLYNIAVENQAEIVSCLYYYEKPDGKKISNILDQKVVLDSSQILKYYVKDKNCVGQIVWNKIYKSCLFSDIRYPEGMLFEDIATTYKVMEKAQKLVITPEPLIHYRVRETSLSRCYCMKSFIDYWKACYEKYKYLSDGIVDQEYLQPLIGECLLAINRMWRGYGGCSPEEQKSAIRILDDMKAFVAKHRLAVLRDTNYTILQKITCFCVIIKNPILMCLQNKVYNVYRISQKKRRFE